MILKLWARCRINYRVYKSIFIFESECSYLWDLLTLGSTHLVNIPKGPPTILVFRGSYGLFLGLMSQSLCTTIIITLLLASCFILMNGFLFLTFEYIKCMKNIVLQSLFPMSHSEHTFYIFLGYSLDLLKFFITLIPSFSKERQEMSKCLQDCALSEHLSFQNFSCFWILSRSFHILLLRYQFLSD